MGEVVVSEERNRWIDAVARMIKLTQDGTLEWEAMKPADSLKQEPDDIIDVIFQTTYRDKLLRLYKRTYIGHRPVSKPFGADLASLLGVKRETEPYRATEVILDFVSNDGLPLWTYPNVAALSDLLSAVQYQVAGVKDFLNELLSDEA